MNLVDRLNQLQHPMSRRLFQLMIDKKTNLSLSADVTSKKDLLQLVDQVGSEICVLKTHIDIVEDFDEDLIKQLQVLSDKHQFLIFEDRKFADIGNTVKKQYASGIYHIADWADITNAHIVPGPGIIEGLKEIGKPKGNALLILAQMSSQDNLLTKEYTERAIELAKMNKDFVIGFIAQEKLTDDPELIHFTPGVQLSGKGDALGQQYQTPETVIGAKGSDIMIVGRGIYAADQPAEMARKYREIGWALMAY